MAINITNSEADSLTRKFARMAGVSITQAIVIAMEEAIARRRNGESPQETAERLRRKYGVRLNKEARQPLPREVYDRMWER